MSNLKSSAPMLVVALLLVLAGGMVVWRLAGFGKEINEVTHRKR